MNKQEWISVIDRLPDKSDYYATIWIDKYENIHRDILWFDINNKYWFNQIAIPIFKSKWIVNIVLYWLPLPEIPED